MKILLDAGHYSYYNKSAIFPSYYEGNMTWKLQTYLKQELESYGFEVDTTRSNRDTDITVYKRGQLSKDYDLFLSLHSNASNTRSVDRVVIIKRYDNRDNTLAKKLALAIENTMDIRQSHQIYTRRSSSGGEYYGVLRGAKSVGTMQAYIIEHSFHTNYNSARWLYNDNNLKELAKVEAKTIAEHYGYKKKETKQQYLRVLVDNLNIHKTPDFDSSSVCGTVHKGTVVTVVEKIEREGTDMYLVKAGYYITVSPKYVEVFTR